MCITTISPIQRHNLLGNWLFTRKLQNFFWKINNKESKAYFFIPILLAVNIIINEEIYWLHVGKWLFTGIPFFIGQLLRQIYWID